LRVLAEADGVVVGEARYGQFPDMYHPRRFWADVAVDPRYQRQGIGTALYTQLLADLERLEPLTIRIQVRDDLAQARRFATRHGYQEDRRSWESRIVPADFDPAPYAAHRARVAADGVEIRTLAELAADPEYRQKLFAMFVEIDEDEPRPDPYTPLTYDQFEKRTFGDPNYLPEAYFIALKDGEYVGQTSLGASQGNAELYTGLTGVKRANRRRGIALALKLHALDYARAAGASVVKTWNDSINRPMLSINERLGFVKQPAWIDMVRVLREE
jgi:GNAT superfamily N-acetyltransferase